MRGIDTNLLVRYLAADDGEQFQRAVAFFRRMEEEAETLFITGVALCELVWVLSGRRYGYERLELAAALERILGTGIFQVQDRRAVQEAIADYRAGSGDFADYLIGRLSRHAGARDTVTFDTRLEGELRFSCLEAGDPLSPSPEVPG